MDTSHLSEESVLSPPGLLLDAVSPARGRAALVHMLPLGAIVGAFSLLYFKPFVDLLGIWLSDENLSHALLIPPIIGYIVWTRRQRLMATERRPAASGLFIVALSLAVLLVGTAGVEFFLMRTSALGVIVGMVVYLAGWQWLRVLLFPISLLALAIPIPPVIFYQVTFPLQILASKFGF